ncbi:TPA: type II/IV secretion system ATPase subunit [Candidatus Woesearchaeota archaeon]|nr:MAG: hypothetical protein QT07_C0010G0014 [archaeon GW2011_AR16]HIG96017.1 type II/IV secretion system ATPase subunit [Candidatus Woesearchaeota archaeon]HII88493.1 type II/IV secretion system ATPase subunit [Candidatus Woesearchaeota archaeon]
MVKESWKYDVIREGNEIMIRCDCENLLRVPSLEDDPIYLAKAIDMLIETGGATKIIFVQKRDFEYDYKQTAMLMEIVNLILTLHKQRDMFSLEALSADGRCKIYAEKRYNVIQLLINRKIKEEPIGAYVELKRMLREEQIQLDKTVDKEQAECLKKYMSVLHFIMKSLERTRLVMLALPHLDGYHIGDRDVYREIFDPVIKPDFMFTKIMAQYPHGGDEIDNYLIGDDIEVSVFSFPNSVKYLYHVTPPEFKLGEEEYDLLDMARKVMAEHKPTREEFVNPKRMREVFFHVGRDLMTELANYKNIKLTDDRLEMLTKILVRYTVGFGLIEVLLMDEKIQDISVNSPYGRTPMFIVHGDYADCDTNITPTKTEAESWASKLRMISGRPLDEANPILDAELRFDFATARISTITEPLNPTGLAFSFRRHRNKPWTLPLFIKQKMITPLAAGLLSFIVDGTRTILIAGTRSSGKSSFLTALMVEVMRRYRMITVEDTLELPTDALAEMGFNIQPMKVASALVKGSSEMSAADGIRSTLRLGDSALIVGEVRSKEAVALYEAMRVGASANVVAGTIHGDSPYGVFDRVVNDIGVPKTSFKATDIIIIANPIRSADGIHRVRRVTNITEVRKHWENDPLLENGFVDLMKYDSKSDQLQTTDDFINGESDVLKAIAANVPDFAGDWEALWRNIELRAHCKEEQVKMAEHLNEPDLLEAPFTIRCNDLMHILSDQIKKELGKLDEDEIFKRWKILTEREAKRFVQNKLRKEGKEEVELSKIA